PKNLVRLTMTSKSQAESKPKYISLVPAVEQASKILLCLAQDQSDKKALTDICKQVGIHKSKAYSILNTLRHFGFIEKDLENKTYSLGPGLLFLSSRVLNKLDLREAVAPFLEKLSRETTSTALLCMIADQYAFVVAKDEGFQDIGVTIKLGHRFPITWGAHGKAIAAFLSDSDRKRVLSGEKLYFHGDPLRFDRDRLEEELARCRKTGFAIDLGEMKVGIHAVAAPVFGPTGKLVGSIVVMGTFPGQLSEKYGSQVAEMARGFSETIGGIPQNRDIAQPEL
ncbi:MAG TPA: IclR family transcriptional regulator, partial [Thermodesulfobacteriota bacterium]|nr:IclR family transcriptional regulator [Thermodesulfobacteriota bacterium]